MLHLASLCLTDAELRLEGADDPAFAELKVRHADVLGGAPAGMPPDRGMELELETGGVPMPRSRPVKRLSEGELSELLAMLIDLLDRGWIQLSAAGHAAAVVFARKADGSWQICYDYRGLDAITRQRLSRCRTSTRCSTARGGRASSPNSSSPAVITSCGCGPRTGGRRASGRNWASSSGTLCCSACRAPPLC